MNVKHSIDRLPGPAGADAAGVRRREQERKPVVDDLNTSLHYLDIVKDATKPSAHEPWVSMYH